MSAVKADMTPDVTFSKRFQAEVAAIALKESAKVLMTMPISEFTEMCAEVSVFLLRGSDRETGASPGQQCRRIAIRLRDCGGINFWMSTPIAEIADWIDDLEFVLEDEKRLREEED